MRIVAIGGEPRAIGGEPALLIAVEQPGDAAVGLVVGADRRQAAARVVAPAVGVAAQLVQPVGAYQQYVKLYAGGPWAKAAGSAAGKL